MHSGASLRATGGSESSMVVLVPIWVPIYDGLSAYLGAPKYLQSEIKKLTWDIGEEVATNDGEDNCDCLHCCSDIKEPDMGSDGIDSYSEAALCSLQWSSILFTFTCKVCVLIHTCVRVIMGKAAK